MTTLRCWGPLAGGLALSLGCGGSTLNPVGGGPGGANAGGAQATNAGDANSSPSGGADANGSGGADSSPLGGADSNPAGGAFANGSGGADALPSGGAPPALAALAGTWTGYIENYHFADKSDAIELVLDNKGAGHLTVGASPAPAPPKNFDVGYAPALTSAPALGGMSPIFVGLYPGFSFTLRAVSLVGQRIQFDVSGSELSALWCEHQAPYADNQGHYACAPTSYGETADGVCTAIDPGTMKNMPMDCGKLSLCGGGSPCACTAKACAQDPAVDLVHFDLRLDIANAAGSAAGLDASVHNAYLTQVSR